MINKRTYLGIPLLCRRNRRRLVVGYWISVLFVLIFGSVICWREALSLTRWWVGPVIGLAIGTLITFLGGVGSVGPIPNFDGDTTPPPKWAPLAIVDSSIRRLKHETRKNVAEYPLDERDLRLRNAAHYEAYRLLREFVVPIAGAIFVALLVSPSRYKLLAAPIILFFVLVIYNLPQTLILWWEPDMEDAQ